MNSFAQSLAPQFARFQPVPIPFHHLTALKWLAILSMVADHVRYLPGMDFEVLLHFGRLAFPLFCFVLSFHVARAFMGEDDNMLERMLVRLMGFGLLAQVPYVLLFGKNPGELNVLFTFALAVGMVRMPLLASVLAFIFLGGFVDYYWPGLMFFFASFLLHLSMMRSQPRGIYLTLMLGSFFVLSLTVSNYAAFAAIPFMIWSVVGRLNFVLPRWNTFFYLFYPLHLSILVGLQSLAV